MWTVNVHSIAAAIVLMFEELFGTSPENHRLFDSGQVRQLARGLSEGLQQIRDRCDIARRGVKIIDFLLALDTEMKCGRAGEFNLSQIISYVRGDDPGGQPPLAMCSPPRNAEAMEDISWPSPGVNTWESILDFIGCAE